MSSEQWAVSSQQCAVSRKTMDKKICKKYCILSAPGLLFTAFCLLLTAHCSPLCAQKIAVLTPDKTVQSEALAEKLAASLSGKFKVTDLSPADSVLRVKDFETPYNLTNIEAKNLGTAVGCSFFVLIKTNTQRRTSFERDEFYESYAVLYLVSSRTGRLVFWTLEKFEGDSADAAREKLFSATDELAARLGGEIRLADAAEISEKNIRIDEIPDENSAEAKGFRPPLPYRRLKPEYTRIASYYDVTATVDALVDIDADGTIRRTEIVRWAGFGLDEAVEATIRRMNWKPADRDGRTLPMRVLLRYNFRNIETD
jgi:hypothetical protein